MKKVVFIIAQKNFRDEELLEPLKIFSTESIQSFVASEARGPAEGKLGTKVEAQLAFDEIRLEDFDAIIFVGGKAARIYAENPEVWKLAQLFANAGKIVGAIGTAPTILANAAILLNRKATADHEEKDTMVMRGAEYTSLQVQVDGRIVTARGPADARDFAKKIVELLKADEL